MVPHAAVEFRPCAKRLHAALAPERSRTIDGDQLPRRAQFKTAATKGDTNRSIRAGPGSRDACVLRAAPATPPVTAPRPCRPIDRDARPFPAHLRPCTGNTHSHRTDLGPESRQRVGEGKGCAEDVNNE